MTTPFDEIPTAQGRTQFSLRAMEKVIHAAIASVPGTAAVDAKLAGLAGRAFPRVMAQMDPDAKVVAVDADIAVYWPSPVTDVASAVRSAISDTVRDFTGFRTTRVNVTVGGAVAGERTSALAVSTRTPLVAQIPAIVPAQELKEIKTSQGVAVRQIAVPAAPAVRGVATPQAVQVRTSGFGPSPQRYDELRDITTAPEQPLRHTRDPQPATVRSVTMPSEFRPRSVDVPRPLQPRPVSAPRPRALRRVDVPRPVEPHHVTAPRATALRTPQVAPSATSRNLRPIEIRPSADFTRRVDIPRPTPLRAITITPFAEGAHHE
ncbi:Asp23/Gls24 family envelope stress response protein [Corynebacterium singulare]|uniref:Asp23/Gls24 family envelope stress response protein n=1 Tax=Corynebacterium singulare TaxID=161899 RepID=UPI0021B3C333|nr:Asp23/Gls24 family envelope stress response protein [Corynebacterium singulare]